MTSKREISNSSDLIDAYLSGCNVSDMLKANKISGCLFDRLLRDAGIKKRTKSEAYAIRRGSTAKSRAIVDNDSVCKRYIANESEKYIADSLGVSRSVINRILAINGIERRGRSDAEINKWKIIKETPGGIERQCGAAWKASDIIDDVLERNIIAMYESVDNSKRSIANHFKTSVGNVSRILRKNSINYNRQFERKAKGTMLRASMLSSMVSRYEIPIIEAIINSGLKPVHQYAIGTSNVDIAFPEYHVIVEIERRYITDSRSLNRQRIENIFNGGWRVLVIYDPRKKRINADIIAQQIIRFINFTSLNPSSIGQYGVISGDGQPRAIRGDNFNGWARIEGF